MPTYPAAIPVTILTGFLGSGKTTILNRVLSHRAFSDTAVIINEFGDVALDHLFITTPTETMIVLRNGCLCCTVRGDLVETLATLIDDIRNEVVPAPARLIIETSGLADPVPVLHTFMTDDSLQRYWYLASVITTVDAVNGFDTLKRHDEAVKQVAVADRILLTKSDMVSDETMRRIEHELLDIHPRAPIHKVTSGSISPEDLLATNHDTRSDPALLLPWLYETSHHPRQGKLRHHHGSADAAHRGKHAEHDSRISAHCITVDDPVSWNAFSYWLELLASLRGENMLRVKGIIAVSDSPGQPMVIHGVQHVFHAPVRLPQWPSDDHRSRIVFITRGMDIGDVERTLRKFAGADSVLN